MKGFCIDVSGDFACFTQPHLKADPVSYPVITPSAARGIFDAIFWKPAIRWHINKIEVMNPILWFNIMRNEVKSKASVSSGPLFIEKERTQRSAMILRDVRYRLHASFEFIPPELRQKPVKKSPLWMDEEEHSGDCGRKDETEAKYAAIFERRASRGQCFRRPYLGCREFSCDRIRLVPEGGGLDAPINETKDLGWMLYDMDFSDMGNITPMIYYATMKNGVIEVPGIDSGKVLKCGANPFDSKENKQ